MCALLVAARWDEYEGCSRPLHVWLVTHAALFAAQRLGHAASYAMVGRCGERALLAAEGVRLLGLLPAFAVWTLVGTAWAAEAGDCLPRPNQGAMLAVWLALSYLYVAVYGGVLLLRALLSDEDIEAGRGIATLVRIVSRRGLTDGQIAAELPSRPAGAGAGDCPVCIEPMLEGQPCRRMPHCVAPHQFHADCLAGWLRRKDDCPVCRSPLFKSAAAPGPAAAVAQH